MAIKINFKDEKIAYSYIKLKLKELDYDIDDSVGIDYGLQFTISKDDRKGLVRIYHSNKKGTSLDMSQLKDKILEKDVLVALDLSKDECENEPKKNKKFKLHSLCVGVNKFQDKYFQDLKYAKNDALELNKLIENKFGKGKDKIILTDKTATKNKILGSLRKIKELAKIEDTVFIFLATHGEFIGGGQLTDYYIITNDSKDGNEQNLIESSISMEEIKNLVTTIKAEKKVIFIDTCYSGGMSRRERYRVPPSIREKIFQNFESENFIIITSSQANQTSYECEKLKHGVFTYYLIKGFSGAVDHENGKIDLYTLYSYIYKYVKNYAEKECKGKQHPKFFGSFTGEFSLPLLRKLEVVNDDKKFSFETINCIGIDESGKGDFFGPLVVAGVYVDTQEKMQKLKEIGVKDSKNINDKKIKVIANRIKSICDHEVIAISPRRYNELWKTMINLNEVLAWSHAQSMEKLLGRNSSCDMAISDQFAGKEILLNKLKEKGKKIELLQRPKAEENIAVASASILARDKFIDSLNIMEKTYRQNFSKGASNTVISEAVQFLKKGGNLRDVSKTHFKTTKKVLELFDKEKK